MDNYDMSGLEKFEKPDKDFIKDKECLICLESLDLESIDLESKDLESNLIVKLPCKCANSVYHIICIIKLLHSGENKNFCPHCKTKYIIPIKHPISPNPISQNIQVAPLRYYEFVVINRNIEEINEIYTSKLTTLSQIMLSHVMINSLMNIINLLISSNHPEYYHMPIFQVLSMFYFCKIFFNVCFLLFSKNNIDKIESCLIYSYVYQIVIFGILIYLLAKIKYDYNCTILIINNILLSFSDLAFRIINEYRLTNRINMLNGLEVQAP
jgi:hypothetical protein